MNDISKIDMLEVLRLTRDGRLKDAMARLRPETGAPESRHGESRHAEAHHPDSPAAPKGPLLKTLARRLGDLTGATANLELPHRGRKGAADALGEGQFLARSYTGDGGHGSYKLYLPNSYEGTPMPLLVMLHGCTQSPDDFARGTGMNRLADQHGFLVAYPAQARTANITKCWNWFNPENQQRGGEAALIAGMAREVIRDFAVRPGRVYVAGLSAGGAMAAILGAIYPDVFAAVGVHSGLARGAAHDMASAFVAMAQGGETPEPDHPAVPTIVFHGDRDHTVNPANAARVLAQARGGGAPRAPKVTEGKTAGGVAYTRTTETGRDGRPALEYWAVHGAGHAWSGGNPEGSYTDPTGPDASREMLRFFMAQPERT